VSRLPVRVLRVATIVAALVLSAVPALTGRATGATIAGCPLFPDDNAWQKTISTEPIDPSSTAYITSLGGSGTFLHADFGSDTRFGIPVTVVPADQKLVKIKFTESPDESDPGPYPIPKSARIEGGGDRHVLVVQQDTCKLYELFAARKARRGKWKAGSGAVFDLRSNAQRPAGFTSADAAGLPITPGLARVDEVSAGTINHALRFTTNLTQDGYVDPARHAASSSSDPALPPMGLRLRLKSSFDLSAFTGQAKVILQALKTYGMILADNGSAGFISGASEAGWVDDDLNQLKTVPISAFDAIQHGPIQR
jgi:hypothetical protein